MATQHERETETRRVKAVLRALALDNLRRHQTAKRSVRNAYGKEPCVYCGGPPSTADHVLPRALGGGHLIGNLVPACRKCNGKKGADHPADFFDKFPTAAKRFLARAIYVDDELRELAENAGRYP